MDNIKSIDESNRLNELALFAGAGGGILGGLLLNWRTVCAVELEAYPRQVLVNRQNEGYLEPFPIWDNVCTFDGKPWRGIIDVISGGFPCQDISIAGKGSGLDGERSGLWFEFARIIKEIEPPFVFIENSPMLRTRGLNQVLADIDQAGYDAAWVVLGADNVGAPHRRKRMWVLGVRRDVLDSYVLRRKTELNESRILEEALDETSEGKSCRTNSDVSNTNCTRELQQEGCKQEQRGRIGDVCEEAFGECHVSYTEDQGVMRRDRLIQEDAGTQGTWDCDRGREKVYDCRKWWSPEPGLDRMVDGVAYRVDRLAAIGNGQVPTVASVAFRTLLEIITKQ